MGLGTLPQKVAYIHSSYILPGETFTLGEVLELQRNGINIQVFSLQKLRKEISSFECRKLAQDTIYYPIFSLDLPWSHLWFIFNHPKCYLLTLFYLIKHSFPGFLNLIKSLFIFTKSVAFAKRIKEEKISHVHSPWASSPATAGLIISKLLGVTFSFTAHAWDIFCGGVMLREKLENAAFVITISNYNKQFLEGINPGVSKDKIKVIRCGVYLDNFPPQDRINVERKIILSVAKHTEKKGIIYLLKASKILKEEGLPLQVFIAGWCQSREEKKVKRSLERFIKKEALSDMVIFFDNPTREEITRLYQRADIFVLPCVIAKTQDRDGIPVALMEAMACGLPVISTDISGIPELISHQESGLLTQQKKELELSEAIKSLIKDDFLYSKLSKNGRKKVERDYDIKKNSLKLLEMFSSVIS